MQLMLLSLNAPAVQAIPDPASAAAVARRANDFLAAEVRKRPQRFQGLAALAMQDPDEAARELTRCVKELGLRGALVNGFSQIEKRFHGLSRRSALPRLLGAMRGARCPSTCIRAARCRLGADLRRPSLAARPDLGVRPETAVHALGLMASGCSTRIPAEDHPGAPGRGAALQHLARRPSRAWTGQPPRYPAKRKLGEYFQENFYLATSGNFRTRTLIDPMLEVGSRPDPVLHRLAVREHRPRRALVRRGADQRGRPAKIDRGNAVRLFRPGAELVPAKAGTSSKPNPELRALLARIARGYDPRVVGAVIHRDDLLFVDEASSG